MQRIFAYVFKFLHTKLRSYQAQSNMTDIQNGILLLIKNIQMVYFAREYKAIKEEKTVEKSSKLYSLRPMIDTSGLIRFGVRLQFSDKEFDAKHPVILPKNHPFMAALVMHYHQKFLHAGPQCLLSLLANWRL